VVDASALVEVLLRSATGVSVERALKGVELAAPDLINVEVVHAFRRLVAAGAVAPERGRRAVARLADAPIERVTTTRLALAMWELRHNCTGYDAAYLALALALDRPLVTTDRRLSGAPDPGIEIVAL